jgi:hypothetical protein
MISIPFQLPPSPRSILDIELAWGRLASRDAVLVAASRPPQQVTVVPGIRVTRPAARTGRSEIGGAALRCDGGHAAFRHAVTAALREVVADGDALDRDMALWRGNEA